MLHTREAPNKNKELLLIENGIINWSKGKNGKPKCSTVEDVEY